MKKEKMCEKLKMLNKWEEIYTSWLGFAKLYSGHDFEGIRSARGRN